MTYISALKQGFILVNKNWQLIIVQFLSMIFAFLSFFIIVGIPVAIAFILFGLDVTEILRLKDIVSAFKSTAEMLHKYFYMAIILLISLVVYTAFIVSLWAYTFGGIVGVLKNSVLDCSKRFRFKYFFKYGKIYFFRIITFSSIVGAIFIVAAFVLGILGGIFSAIIDITRSQEEAFAKFITIFFSLLMASMAFFVLISVLSITVYGISAMVFYGYDTIKALGYILHYLIMKPTAIGFYTMLVAIYMIFAFIEILIGSLIILIPFVGSILAVPYQTISYLMQGYIGLVMIAASFYFFSHTSKELLISSGEEKPVDIKLTV